MTVAEHKDIAFIAPATSTKTKSPKRTERYNFISTDEIVSVFKKHHFYPYSAEQPKIYENTDKSKQKFQKHMILFRSTKHKKVNGIEPNIVVVNSHDGTSKLEMMISLRRTDINHLFILSGEDGASKKIRHSSLAKEKMEDAISELVTEIPNVHKKINKMKAVEVNIPDALQIAKIVQTRVWNKPVFESAQLLIPRRKEDNKNTLWHIFNNIQENIIKGGIEGKNENNRRTKTREIRNINHKIEINKIVWEEINKYFEEV